MKFKINSSLKVDHTSKITPLTDRTQMCSCRISSMYGDGQLRAKNNPAQGSFPLSLSQRPIYATNFLASLYYIPPSWLCTSRDLLIKRKNKINDKGAPTQDTVIFKSA